MEANLQSPAKRLTASQHINLSAEVIFTFSSGYWVWIFV